MPSREQQRVLDQVVRRCLEESHDEQMDIPIRSEPLRFVMHGVPGAGKTRTLKWVRQFFEEVCGFTHGKEFVFLAGFNTMAALLGGYTLHSFGEVPFYKKDGSKANVRKRDDATDMSKKFLKYERLRWIIIDECSVSDLSHQGHLEHSLRRSTRETHSWALREDGSERCWGGMNVAFCGDFWQFRPINATAIFDNPFTTQGDAILERMLRMFWTKSEDSLNWFHELTKEVRCKDPWLSWALKGARHGSADHETYCFMHGLPTRHAGSWMPTTDSVMCGNAACKKLPEQWDR